MDDVFKVRLYREMDLPTCGWLYCRVLLEVPKKAKLQGFQEHASNVPAPPSPWHRRANGYLLSTVHAYHYPKFPRRMCVLCDKSGDFAQVEQSELEANSGIFSVYIRVER